MWLGVALRRVHLRLPWLYVAWRRLASLHVGSQPGSQNSLAPLIFEALATRPRRDSHHRWAEQLRTCSGRRLCGLGCQAQTDEADVDPGSSAAAVAVQNNYSVARVLWAW